MDYMGNGLQSTPMNQLPPFVTGGTPTSNGRSSVVTAIAQSDQLIKMIGETAGRLASLTTVLGGPQPEKSAGAGAAPPASGALDALGQKLSIGIDGINFVLDHVSRLEKLVGG